MKFGAFPLQQRPWPKCGTEVPSTVVYSIPSDGIGTHYTFHECPFCGTLVHRNIRFDVANPIGNSRVMTEPVSSEAVRKFVISAATSGA